MLPWVRMGLLRHPSSRITPVVPVAVAVMDRGKAAATAATAGKVAGVAVAADAVEPGVAGVVGVAGVAGVAVKTAVPKAGPVAVRVSRPMP